MQRPVRLSRDHLRAIINETVLKMPQARRQKSLVKESIAVDQISSATAHKILDLAQEACELAHQGGIDHGDPYEATMQQLHDFLNSITV